MLAGLQLAERERPLLYTAQARDGQSGAFAKAADLAVAALVEGDAEQGGRAVFVQELHGGGDRPSAEREKSLADADGPSFQRTSGTSRAAH